MKRDRYAEQGMALLVTLVILAVLSIMATTMVSNMTLDEKSAGNLNKEVSAKYIAQAGLNHALAVLRDDFDFINLSSAFDLHDYTGSSFMRDDWRAAFIGSDVDLADTITRSSGAVATNTPDARWIYVHRNPTDGLSPIIGRYAVLIEDENAKLNINAVGSDYDSVEASQEGGTVDQIDLKDLFDRIGAASPALADAIVASSARPFAETTELLKVAGITQTVYDAIAPYITVDSGDHDLFYDWHGTPVTYYPRININYEPRLDYLKTIFTRMFWGDARKDMTAVLNILDYRDSDHVPSVYAETELGIDMNGDSAISSSTYAYGTEGIQINELLTTATLEIEANDSISGTYIINIDSGNFTRQAQYFYGISSDPSNMGAAVLEIPWDNGTFQVILYSSTLAPTDDVSCRVEGDGYHTVPAGGNHTFTAVVSDGSLTIELEDPVQYDHLGGVASTQVPSKLEKLEIIGGDFIEIANISRSPITLTTGWSIICDNATPANAGDDRTFALSADVTLSGATYTSSTDPKTVTYDYLVLTNSPKLVEMMFDSTVDGVWNGNIAILYDTSSAPTFNLIDSGESITITDTSGAVIDHVDQNNFNDYSVTGFGAVTAKVSKEKVSPDYDLMIFGVAVWNNSTTTGNEASHLATPGAQNSSSGPSFVTVRDGLIPNPYFMYDLAKSEYHNSPANALMGAEMIYSSITDTIGFAAYTLEAADYLNKTSWSLMSGGSGSYLALADSVQANAKMSADCSFSANNVPDGEYRLFLNGLQGDEVHKVIGTYYDSGSGSVVAAEISVSLNGNGLACLNGTNTSAEDELLPFSIENGLFRIEDNCDASTPHTQNTVKTYIFQPSGFAPVMQGKINLNTADAYTIATLPDISLTEAQAIVSYSESSPFSKITDVLNVMGISYSQYCRIANLVTVRSSHFRITVLGQAIRDVDADGAFGPGDVILSEKRCTTSVWRGVEKDDTASPSDIVFYTRSFNWNE